jgi:hypothetical protein
MNKFIFMAGLLLAGQFVMGQNTLKRTSVYAELGGPAGLYSLNADHIIWEPLPWLKVAPGIGLSVFNNTVLDVPVRVSTLWGKRANFLELGLGAEAEWYGSYSSLPEFQTIYFAKFGYRYQANQGGMQLQLALTPLYYSSSDWYSGWFSLALGYAF